MHIGLVAHGAGDNAFFSSITSTAIVYCSSNS